MPLNTVASNSLPNLRPTTFPLERFQECCGGTRESSDLKSHEFNYFLPLHPDGTALSGGRDTVTRSMAVVGITAWDRLIPR